MSIQRSGVPFFEGLLSGPVFRGGSSFPSCGEATPFSVFRIPSLDRAFLFGVAVLVLSFQLGFSRGAAVFVGLRDCRVYTREAAVPPRPRRPLDAEPQFPFLPAIYALTLAVFPHMPHHVQTFQPQSP